MKHILHCPACHAFTMKATCPQCGAAARSTKPPKYSTDDKYAALRRKAKEEGF